MNRKSKKLAKTLAISLLAAMSFRDTGLLVKDFSASGNALSSGQKLEIIQETDTIYLVKAKSGNIEIPKDKMIKEMKSEFTYKVKSSTDIVNQDDKKAFRKLRKNELVDLVYLEGDKGIFKTQDGLVGSVDLASLEESETYTETKAVSKVDRLLKSGNNSFTIKKGSPVKIIGYKADEYIIRDLEGNKYNIAKSDLSLGQEAPATPTRGGLDLLKKPSKDLGGLLANAKKEIGKPYVSGDTGRRGYDCSGFTYAMYLKTFGTKLPRSSGSQASAGKPVSKSNLQPGDLVFFRTGGKNIGHVGLYVGNGNMIHASTGQRRITTTSIHTKYFASRYVTARRVIN